MLAISPDANYIVSKPREVNTICLWDIPSGKCIHTLKGNPRKVDIVDFSPDGRLILSASSIPDVLSPEGEEYLIGGPELYDKTIRIWDVKTGKCIQTLEGHSDCINSASFSPDGSRVVSASRDSTIRIWDVLTGKPIHVLKGHLNDVSSAVFSPDGNLLVSGSTDDIRIWNTKTGHCCKTLNGSGKPLFSPDGRYIVVTEPRSVHIWDVDTNTNVWYAESNMSLQLPQYSYLSTPATFSPDSKHVIVTQKEVVRIWDVTTNAMIHDNYSVDFFAFSPDGNHLAYSTTKAIQVCDAASKKRLKTLSWESTYGHVTSIAYSPDGKLMALATEDTLVRVLNENNGQCQYVIKTYKDRVFNVVFSPDGKCIASESDKCVRVWDVATGQCLQTLESFNSPVYSPDGKHFAIVSTNGNIHILDVFTWKTLLTVEGEFISVSYSLDGKYLVSSTRDQLLQIIDASTGKCLNQMEGHKQNAFASFSPDGKYIVSASRDRTIRVWNVAAGKCVQVITHRSGLVVKASFCPNGRAVVTGSREGIAIYDFLPLEELKDYVRERFKDNPLTPEERRLYYLE